MANTLTGLIPEIYAGLDLVGVEEVGIINSVSSDMTADRVGKNQTVRVPITPIATAYDITPGTNPADNGDQTISYVDMTISKVRQAPVRWNGEEQLAYGANGTYNKTLADQFAQAFRTLRNEVEADLTALYYKASRAYGTAGTTPFASDIKDAAAIFKILKDNGMPKDGLASLVLDSSAVFNMQTLAALTSANQAGTDGTLRDGTLYNLAGLKIKESAQIKSHTKGTGAGYLVDLAAGYGVGDTTIHVDTGTGTILAGDVVTFAGDTNKYLVTVGFAGDGDGDITIAAPGLRQTLANNVAMTIGNSYTANMAFHRDAVKLLTRVPAMAIGPNGEILDAASDVMNVQDPVTGLTFQIAAYSQYKQVKYEVGLAWGCQIIKPEFTAILLG